MSAQVLNFNNYASCPLSFARALRHRIHDSRGEELKVTSQWLIANGWTLGHDRFGRHWRDPLDGDVWTMVRATKLQATREAQRLLSPLGWELDAGFAHGDTWTFVWRVRRQGETRKTRAVSLLNALRQEGFAPRFRERRPDTNCGDSVQSRIALANE